MISKLFKKKTANPQAYHHEYGVLGRLENTSFKIAGISALLPYRLR